MQWKHGVLQIDDGEEGDERDREERSMMVKREMRERETMVTVKR